MPYYPNTDDDRREMLDAIGVKNFDDLIKDIPQEIRLNADLKIPPAMSEFEVVKHLSALAGQKCKHSRRDFVSWCRCIRPFHSIRGRRASEPVRILHGIYTVSGRSQSGNSPIDLRIPNYDLPPDGNGCF